DSAYGCKKRYVQDVKDNQLPNDRRQNGNAVERQHRDRHRLERLLIWKRQSFDEVFSENAERQNDRQENLQHADSRRKNCKTEQIPPFFDEWVKKVYDKNGAKHEQLRNDLIMEISHAVFGQCFKRQKMLERNIFKLRNIDQNED